MTSSNFNDLSEKIANLDKGDSDGRLYGIILKAGNANSWRQVYPENGTDFKLEELYVFVGSPIEVVYTDNKQLMVINEEGKIKGLPLNMTATMFSGLFPDDVIAGDALMCSLDMVL